MKRLGSAALTAVFVSAMCPAALAASAQIWLAGEDPIVQADKHKNQPADYMDLFRPEAPWRQASSRLTALKVSTQFILRGSDEQLKAVFAALQERHIGLAIEYGIIDPRVANPGPGDCGFHVEGYSLSGSTESVARRIKNLGGRLDHVAMDEPVWFGHTAPEIWFNMTNYNMPGGVDGPQGWRKLFVDPDAPWPDFMSHVQVVAAAGIMQVPDDVLAKMFAKLKQKRIAFAMESLAQSWVHEPECGHGVESYYDPPGARKVAEKIKAVAGQIDIVAMDEPLYYGHYYSGRDACHSPISNVAERAAAIVREYQKVFPNVVIGDIEPIPAITSQPNWQNEYTAWMQAFSSAAGQKIAFLHLDINWRGGTGGSARADWQQSLRQMTSFAKDHRLPIGIIYNANVTPAISSDKQWLDGASQNIAQIEGKLGITPAQAVFHSWDRFPRRSITDETGLGEDFLVKYYLARHAQ